MSNNLCNEAGKKTIRINDQEVKKAETLGLENVSASTVFSELLDMGVKLHEIKKHKRKEARELRAEAEELEDFYELWGVAGFFWVGVSV